MKVSDTKRNQLLLVVMVGAILMGLWVYYSSVFKPLTNAISQQGQTIQQTSVSLEHLQQAISREPQVRQEFEQLSARMGSLRSILPYEKELPRAIEWLSDLASTSGVKIQTIFPQRTLEGLGLGSDQGQQPTAPKAPTLYKEIPIQIDALAGFHQLGTFIGQVESGSQPMRLRSLRISGNDQEPRRQNSKIVFIAFFASSPQDRTATKDVAGAGGS